MAFAKSLVFIGLIFAIFSGQLFRLSLGSTSFPLIDLLVFLVFLVTPKTKIQNKPLLFFVVFAWFSLLINYFLYHHPFSTPALYLFRLSCLLSFLIFPLSLPQNLKRLLIIALTANIVFGLLQYFFWPDFTYFKALGWDDHLNRLISTYFDPTFTGLIYLMFFFYLYFKYPKLLPLVLIPLALTYSRSTFLSLFICLLFITLKTKKILTPLVLSFMFCVLIFLLPRSPGEGTKLERTSSINAKIVNYQEAFSTIRTSPIIGHGYNNLPFVRPQSLPSSHANAGFDSSLLTILATTGVIGFGLWIFGFIQVYRQSSLFKQTLLVAIFIHSLFANSLLYPWTLVLFVLL